MINNETYLLYSVLCFEKGYSRRIQHVLKVYALARLLGELEKLSIEEQQILQAAAILRHIVIKYCKQCCNGKASQENQQKEASYLVYEFLSEANYMPSYISQITELVLYRYDFISKKNKLLQILIEADVIIDCYEGKISIQKTASAWKIFQTTKGKELLELCIKN